MKNAKTALTIHFALYACIFLTLSLTYKIVELSFENGKKQTAHYLLGWVANDFAAATGDVSPEERTELLKRRCARAASPMAFFDESGGMICSSSLENFDRRIVERWKSTLPHVKKDGGVYFERRKIGETWESEHLIFVAAVPLEPNVIYVAGAVQAPLLIVLESWNFSMIMGFLVVILIMMELIAARIIMRVISSEKEGDVAGEGTL